MKKFNKILLIILLIESTLFASTYEESENACKKLIKKIPEARLKKFIFCDYDMLQLPPSINEKIATQLDMELAPKTATFNEDTGNLEMIGSIFYEWTDPFLTWDVSLFDNITMLKVISRDLWEPMIMALSAGNENSNDHYLPYDTPCTLRFNGRISCRNHIPYMIRCKTDYSKWPFDRQNCTLILSTWLRSTDEIKINKQFWELTLYMHDFVNDKDWTMTATRLFFDERKSSYSKNPNATSPRVSIDFILDREQNHLTGRFISPAILMMVMTLTTLWLDPKSIERLALACLNIVVHFYCIQDLHIVIPHNGSTVPFLLIFEAYSLILATIALLLTIFLGNLLGIKIDSPKWISSSTTVILRSKVGQYLLMSILDPQVMAQIEPDINGSSILMINSDLKTTSWGCVAVILSWISFLGCVITYTIMYINLIPNSSMKPPLKAVGYLSPMEYI